MKPGNAKPRANSSRIIMQDILVDSRHPILIENVGRKTQYDAYVPPQIDRYMTRSYQCQG
jgi:hypothetical protein